MGRRERVQAKYDRRKAAAEEAARRDQEAKEKLAEKQAKHSPGKLTRAELKLSRRMGEGEGEKEKEKK